MTHKLRLPRLNRRDFVRSCVGFWAFTLQRLAHAGELGPGTAYTPSRLVDEHGSPFRASRLEPGETYLFHYPFRTTPCFLIDLGEPARAGRPLRTDSGEKYEWPGGTGPDHSIVAFSAICAHKMTHPAKSVSFINYRHETINYVNDKNEHVRGDHLIYCCSERSVYDVRDGARVLGGPANQPLAAIGLDYEPDTGALTATDTFGGEMFEKYFAVFTGRLQLEYEITDVRNGVGESTLVQHIDEFTNTRVMC